VENVLQRFQAVRDGKPFVTLKIVSHKTYSQMKKPSDNTIFYSHVMAATFGQIIALIDEYGILWQGLKIGGMVCLLKLEKLKV
jgi:hypothetical protein